MPTDHPRISVIIPVYNAARFLHACIDSLCRQTYRDIEIICVDDGSIDNSRQIINEYASQDLRIRLLHQKNQYAGKARQLGMEAAKGEYLAFVDSDDFFEASMLEELISTADKEQSEIVLCSADCYRESKRKYKQAPWMLRTDLLPPRLHLPFCPAREIPEQLFNFVVLTPWAKLFRTAFVRKHSLCWSGEKHANDILFVGSALTLAKRVSLVEKELVHYRVRSDSSANSNNKDMTIHYRAFLELYENLLRLGCSPRIMQGFREHLIKALVGHWATLSPAAASELRSLARNTYEPTFKLLDIDISAYEQQSAYALYRAIVRPRISYIFHEHDIPKSALKELLLSTTEQPTLDAELILLDTGSQPDISRLFDSFADLRFCRILTDHIDKELCHASCSDFCHSSTICHLCGAVTALPNSPRSQQITDSTSGFTLFADIEDSSWHDSMFYLRAGGMRQLRLFYLPIAGILSRVNRFQLTIFGLPIFLYKRLEKMNQIRESYRVLWLPLWQKRIHSCSIEYYFLGIRVGLKHVEQTQQS